MILKRLVIALLLLLGIAAAYVAAVALGLWGQHEAAGTPVNQPRPLPVLTQRPPTDAEKADRSSEDLILFGDLHVHTTFSRDAFIMSLPIVTGGGAHPPADACDFARYCSGLDFWGISDHAEGLSPRHWEETREAVRQCNAVSDPETPDLVTFLGFEWSQQGSTPENHYGHKNVFFADTADDKVPSRPISAGTGGLPLSMMTALNTGLSLLDFDNRQRYYDHQVYLRESTEPQPCPEGVASPQLPPDCVETAPTAEGLFRKLDEWGFDALVIPHGNSWGITAPMGTDWATQLTPESAGSQYQNLIEVFSGHGNNEEYRDWREINYNAQGEAVCPRPSEGYLPGCYRAGEIIAQRCRDAGESPQECQQRRQQAEQNYLQAGLLKGFLTVPGASIDDWGTSDQCADCFMPAYNYIPRASAQYALALSRPRENDDPLRFRFGMIGSSDNHAAMPGTGYKDFSVNLMTESRVLKKDWLGFLIFPNRGEPQPRSRSADDLPGGAALDRERYASFSYTGGLVAVHSPSRQRQDIWSALKQRQVYATSGDRMLLWFDLLNDPQGVQPMGSQTRMTSAPSFQVRATGAPVQKPGCPQYSQQALGDERLKKLCLGECYNPSDKRHAITAIEVVRILPQQSADEDVAPLIQDPWQRFECPGTEHCEVEFSDPEFETLARDALYYVRALQEPTPMINGQPMLCEEKNAAGDCIRYHRCEDKADARCQSMNQERAWSSPIFIDYRS